MKFINNVIIMKRSESIISFNIIVNIIKILLFYIIYDIINFINL